MGHQHSELGREGTQQTSDAGQSDGVMPHGLLAAGNAAVSRLFSVQRDPIVIPPERIRGPNDPLSGTTTGDLTPRAARPLVRLGSTEQAVAELQVRLNEDGADPRLTPSGTFDAATDQAVRAFQRRHGLLVDGIVGPQTWGMLDELSRAGILGRHDVLAGTHTVSDAEAQAVAGHMVTTPPAPGQLTGGGDSGPYETEIFAALDAFYDDQLANVAAAPTVDIGEAQTIGRIAQRLVDDFYADHIVMASRPPGLDQFHPGSYRLPVADAATRQVAPEFARAWVEIDIQFARSGQGPSPQPGEVSSQHGVDTRRPPDAAEVRRVADKYLHAGRMSKVVDMIRTYPAEASEAATGSGPIFVGLGDPSFQGRQGRWDMLSGMMHEYLHIAAHPHFAAAAERMGGAARRVLIEGMCDYFRVQAWNALAPRFESDAGLRRDVEGQFFTAQADPAAIVPHATYDEIANARQIVAELDRPPPDSGGPIPIGSAGGEANARAAYFLGHVDLLGIGPATRGDHAAGDLGTRGADDDTDADVYVVPPGGESLGTVETRTNSTRVFTMDGLGLVDPTQQFTAGTRLRVDGIRYVRAVRDDTRAQVANQNGVELQQLEVANRWAAAPGDTSIRVGTRVLIPGH